MELGHPLMHHCGRTHNQHWTQTKFSIGKMEAGSLICILDFISCTYYEAAKHISMKKDPTFGFPSFLRPDETQRGEPRNKAN